MSLQRAAVNCERCYSLSRPLGDDEKEVDGEIPSREYQQYSARNEAMKALEEERGFAISGGMDLISLGIIMGKEEGKVGKELNEAQKEVEAAERALNACRSCDYSASLISDVFDEVIVERE